MPVSKRRVEELQKGFLAGRSPNTVVAYEQDLDAFAVFFSRRLGRGGMPFIGTQARKTYRLNALRTLLLSTVGRANEIAQTWKSEMVQSGRAPGTVNRRMACLKSFVKWARMAGEVPWAIEVTGVRSELSRDTRGPSLEIVGGMLSLAAKKPPPRGARDVALIRVLFDLALRIGECVKLDLADVELDSGSIWILGKGRRNKVLLSLPVPTQEALKTWIGVRGPKAGPLFLSYCYVPAHHDRRLLTRSIYRIVRNYGARLGQHVRPHGLRHSSITSAVDAATKAGMSLDQVQQFSRHQKIDTLLTYRDRLQNVQGQLAGLVAEQLLHIEAGGTPRGSGPVSATQV